MRIDLTQSQTTEVSETIQQNKLLILGKLAASLAHEIRNPLFAIKLNLDYLQMSEKNFSTEEKEAINSSLEAANIIQYLIENTLEFSRKSNNDKEYISINAIITQALELSKSLRKHKNISFNCGLNDSLPLIYMNRNNILQVVVNLITNAVEASPANSRIELKTYFDVNENLIVFEVQDYGIGITEKDKEKIFSDFYTNKKKGTGIGLGVCKKILEEHDSSIEFISSENKGTTFFVRFKNIKVGIDENKNSNR